VLDEIKPKVVLSVKDFVDDFKSKLPESAHTIKLFAFTDKTSIYENKEQKYTSFTFVPARINIVDKSGKALGFMSVSKLIEIYGESLKIRCYESQWSKLDRKVKINVIQIELTPKISKSGKEYYKTDILPIPASNTKAIEALDQYYELTPNCKYSKPMEYTECDEFAEGVGELDCV
jgi:hypothetical protein